MSLKKEVSVILLAGGTGSRMNSLIPKQYLVLAGKPLVFHSFEIFCSMPEVAEIIIVCAPDYRSLFTSDQTEPTIRFAMPGNRRQDSVFNGFQATNKDSKLVCIHDAARPFVDAAMTRRAIEAAIQYGAATVGMPIKFTVKECDKEDFVRHTPERSRLWEIQTPQVIQTQQLQRGLEFTNKENITVTDDVSLVELLNLPVKIVKGTYENLKITTPEDLILAGCLLDKRRLNDEG